MTKQTDSPSTPPMPVGMLFERDDLRYQITCTKERRIYYEFKPGNDYQRENFNPGELENILRYASRMVPVDQDSNLEIAETAHGDTNHHFMVDIESLGTRPGSVVFEIAIVKFDPATAEPQAEYTVELSAAYQRSAGMVIDVSTIAWWHGKGRDIEKEQAAKNIPDANTQLQQLVSWIETLAPLQETRRFWCRGVNFDPVLLEPLFEVMNCRTPWQYWQWRDIRTLQGILEVYGVEISKPKNTAHTALADCHAQIRQVAHLLTVIASSRGGITQ